MSLLPGYEQTSGTAWVKDVTFDTANPATYEIEIVEVLDELFELTCYRVSEDGKRTPLDFPPKQSESFIALDRIGQLRIEQAEARRKAKHTQRDGKIVTTGSGRKVRIGRA